jgi:hypothetical protein
MRPAIGALLALGLTGALLPAAPGPARAEDKLPAAGREEGEAPPRPNPPAPLRSYTDKEGRLCRVYERRVVINGEPTPALATVCREPNGRWVLSR